MNYIKMNIPHLNIIKQKKRNNKEKGYVFNLTVKNLTTDGLHNLTFSFSA